MSEIFPSKFVKIQTDKIVNLLAGFIGVKTWFLALREEHTRYPGYVYI
jgi:hypothetical protein